MERIDGPKRPGMRLPVEVAEWQPGNQSGRKKLVDIVRIVILDCRREGLSTSTKQGYFEV
jgi:hypothetical protein